MRKPLRRNAAVDNRRVQKWISRFASYRGGVTRQLIEDWLGQFDAPDKDIAARILDAVEFYGDNEICAAYRSSLQSLPRWNYDDAKREGKWRFVAMSGSAGESGDTMLHKFRLANNLGARRYNNLFIYRSQLVKAGLSNDDTVVLVDDFSGSGEQICNAWSDPDTSFGELLAGVGSVYLILVVASQAARVRIQSETTMNVLSQHELYESDNVFSDQCRHFDKREKDRLLHYGSIARKSSPKGYGDCGFLLIFSHRAPNNSIPILHANHKKWQGLFPRH